MPTSLSLSAFFCAPRQVRHFTNACTRILGLEARNTFERGRHCSFEYQGRLIALEICPAGIDPQKFAPAIAPPAPSLVTSSVSSAAVVAAATATPVSSSTAADAAAVAVSAAASAAAAAASAAVESATALAASGAAGAPAADSNTATANATSTAAAATAVATAVAVASAVGPEVLSEGVAAAATLEQQQQQLREEAEESLTPAPGAPSHTSAGLAPRLPLTSSSSSSDGKGDGVAHDPNQRYRDANKNDSIGQRHGEDDGSGLALRLASRCQRSGGKVVVLLAAGLDWCKGLPQMLVALAAFFHRNPTWRSRVTVYVVVRDVPGRADPSLRQMV